MQLKERRRWTVCMGHMQRLCKLAPLSVLVQFYSSSEAPECEQPPGGTTATASTTVHGSLRQRRANISDLRARAESCTNRTYNHCCLCCCWTVLHHTDTWSWYFASQPGHNTRTSSQRNTAQLNRSTNCSLHSEHTDEHLCDRISTQTEHHHLHEGGFNRRTNGLDWLSLTQLFHNKLTILSTRLLDLRYLHVQAVCHLTHLFLPFLQHHVTSLEIN